MQLVEDKNYDNFINNMGPKYQEAIVGHMIYDSIFLLKCRQYITDTKWFTDHLCGNIVKEIFNYYDNHQTPPSPETIVDRIHQSHMDFSEYNKYDACVKSCINSAKIIPIKDIQDSMNTWIKQAIFKSGFNKSMNQYNQRKLEDAVRTTNKTAKDLQEIDFNSKMEVDFNDAVAFCDRVTEKKKQRCTLGTAMFDSILVDDAIVNNPKVIRNGTQSEWTTELCESTRGSLFMGDATCIVGSTNVGKTRTLISIISANILLKKHVLYITLEQTSDDIKQMVLMSYTGYKAEQLSMVKHNKEIRKIVEYSGNELQKYLTYIPHLKVRLIAEDILAIIEQKQRELKHKAGKGYDLVVIDYPAKCKSELYINKNSSSYEEKKYIYSLFIQSALVNQYHIILPVQTNRDGYKVNRGDAKRMVDVGDVSESFGITQEATNVITINRNAADVKNNVITYYVSKCRSKKIGYSYMTYNELGIARTHHVSLPAIVLEPGTSTQEGWFTLEKKQKDDKTEILSEIIADQQQNTVIIAEQNNPVMTKEQEQELNELNESDQEVIPNYPEFPDSSTTIINRDIVTVPSIIEPTEPDMFTDFFKNKE